MGCRKFGGFWPGSPPQGKIFKIFFLFPVDLLSLQSAGGSVWGYRHPKSVEIGNGGAISYAVMLPWRKILTLSRDDAVVTLPHFAWAES